MVVTMPFDDLLGAIVILGAIVFLTLYSIAVRGAKRDEKEREEEQE